MKIKRMLATCLAGIVMVSAMAIPASAAPGDPPNHTDTTFSFNFSNFGRSNTEGREKNDDSGTYIVAYTMCSGGFDVFVDGRHSNGSSGWVDCTDKQTRGQPHLRTANNPGLISQWVNELGYDEARLGGYKPLAFCTVSGKWSPDSIGTYRYLGSST